jgi:hypothetical protein
MEQQQFCVAAAMCYQPHNTANHGGATILSHNTANHGAATILCCCCTQRTRTTQQHGKPWCSNNFVLLLPLLSCFGQGFSATVMQFLGMEMQLF